MQRGVASPPDAAAGKRAQQRSPVSSAETSLRWMLAIALALGLAHPFYRSPHLGVEYYDGYDYLRNARALAGDPLAAYQRLRPPFVSIVQLPAMAIVRASPPAAPVRLFAPHLTSAVVSLLSAAAVFGLFLRSFGATLAMLGTLLFVTTRYYVHYGPHVMADLPSAGWAAASASLYLRARERRSFPAYAVCGLALGAGILTKYPLAVLGPAWVLAELWLTTARRRIDVRSWIGIGIVGVVCVASFLAVQVILMCAVYGSEGLAILGATLAEFATVSDLGAQPDETWRDYGAMSVAMLSLPTLLLCGSGILLSLWRRDERDVIPLASLACLGGTIVFLMRHTEARYLLPAVPFILYFTMRSVETAAGALRARWPGFGWARRGLALLVGAATLGSAAGVGVHQALLDEDPVYRADVERRAAERLLAARRGDGRLLWLGYWHPLRTRWAGRVAHDEFMGIFHYPPFAAVYFLDCAVYPIRALNPRPDELASFLEDGDAVLRTAARDFDARQLPPAGAPPMEVWSARRLRFRATGGGDFVDVGNSGVHLRLLTTAAGASLSASALTGEWQVKLIGESEASGSHAGTVVLAPGVAAPLSQSPDAPVRALELFQLERTPIL